MRFNPIPFIYIAAVTSIAYLIGGGRAALIAFAVHSSIIAVVSLLP